MDQLLESLYWIKIAADGGLARVAFRFRKQMPAFFYYRLASILRSAVLLPLHLASSEQAYSRFNWLTRPLESVFFLWFAGELVGRPDLGFALGFLACVYQLFIAIAWQFRLPDPAAVVTHYLTVDQIVTALAAMAALYAWGKADKRLMASGLIIVTIFPAIWESTQVGGWLRFVPTISVLAAQAIWVVALYRQPTTERQ